MRMKQASNSRTEGLCISEITFEMDMEDLTSELDQREVESDNVQDCTDTKPVSVQLYKMETLLRQSYMVEMVTNKM